MDALSRINHLPTAVEPVKDILRINLLLHISSPTLTTSGLATVTMFITPGGIPASYICKSYFKILV